MNKNKLHWLGVIALMLLITACQQHSIKPKPVCPSLPNKPTLSTPMPSATYSESAAADIQSWQQKLMDTQLMRKK